MRRLLYALAILATLSTLGVASAGADVPLSISVKGNQFIDGAGQPVRLLGVNHPSFEYGCVDGFGYDDGHMDAVDAAAIASWHANAVRVPLNEDCWLGINGQPNSSEGANPPLTQTGYQQAVEQYVADLNADGVYAILDLHWTAPGSSVANGQEPMPDDHSAAFWTSVASTFKADPGVLFDVFNEPYSPADPRSGNEPNYPVSWDCWDNGGCTVPVYQNTDEVTASTYTAVGMQALVTAIRQAGATQPVVVGGLNYANDLSGWVDHAPDDPLDQEAASFHNYQGQSCDDAACWDSTIAAVAANVPVVTGEFDEDDFDESQCQNSTPSTFDQDYMNWADQHGVSYLAWGWWVLTQQEQNDAGCSAYYLLDDYNGTPAAPNGTVLHDHLAALAAAGAGSAPGTGTSGAGTGGGGGAGNGGKSTGASGSGLKAGPDLRRLVTHLSEFARSIRFSLTSSQTAKGALTVRTLN
ncbi:MAG: cellulase family glycosylhydrolase, partial [Solirubrobacteraceae bacterium]